MKTYTFLLLLVFAQSCIANDNCNNPETQHDMNICSGIKLRNIEAELEKKVRNISSYLKKIDGSSIFIKSNEAWIKYRDLHCESISKIYESGSIHSLVESECKVDLTKERINNLDNDYKDTINSIVKGNTSANRVAGGL